MKSMSIDKLAAAVGGYCESSSQVSGVSIDSRKVRDGDAFFAIAGENFDGHDYINQAFANGAVCAVCSRDVDCGDKPVIIVEDTVKALGKFANYYRNKSGFKVVGITGSAGKTTTRQIACHVLKQHFKCHQAQKSFNNNIGLPLTLLGADENCDIVVAEIGTNNPGEIAELTAIAEPDVAVVNNIFPAHLEGLGTIDGIIAEKASIAEGLKPGGKFLINGDFDGLAAHCRKRGVQFISFGTGDHCDIRGEKLVSYGINGSVTIEGIEVSVPLGGMGNLHNVISAWGVCSLLGITADQFAKAIKTLPPLSMRMDIKQIGPVTLIDDCYNANPASMKNAVEVLAALADSRNKRSVFVCGYMAELGDDSDRLHEELGEFIAEADIDTVLVTGRQAERVAGEIRRLQGDKGVIAFSDTGKLCENIINYVRSDDIILIKGSRSGRLEAAVERISEIFGDKQLTKSD